MNRSAYRLIARAARGTLLDDLFLKELDFQTPAVDLVSVAQDLALGLLPVDVGAVEAVEVADLEEERTLLVIFLDEPGGLRKKPPIRRIESRGFHESLRLSESFRLVSIR